MAICVGLAGTLWWRPRPLLLWNASSSSPIGLYGVYPATGIKTDDIVIARLPAPMRELADRRRYLPAGMALVKPVAATAGARICAEGEVVTVNGRRAALRLRRDRHGRRLPWWWGCKRLQQGELFLLSANAPEAFDGRYFGVTGPSGILGKGSLLWPR